MDTTLSKYCAPTLFISPKFVIEDEKYKPVYANDTDYCMDLKVKIESAYSPIAPKETKVFGTGLKVAVPEGWGLFIIPRSSTGFKLNCMLANTVGMIDSGYRDEIKVCVYNFGTETVTLEDGQRLCQMYMLPRYVIEPQYVKDDENFRQGDRGGGIGSTGIV